MFRDLRQAVRSFLRSPGFTIVSVLTLALGIGATTAIFSVVHGVLLEPRPFPGSERLAVLWETDRNSGTTREPASLPDYFDYRERARSFDTLAALTVDNVNLTTGDGVALRTAAVSSTHEYLPMIGVRPLLGRTLTAAETAPGGGDAVMISERLWTRLYDRAPDVLGRSLRLDGAERTITGIVPDQAAFGLEQILGSAAYVPGSAGPGDRLDVGLWTPLQENAASRPRSNHGVVMVGRLAADGTRAAAQAEAAAVAASLEASWPENAGRGARVEPLDAVVFGGIRPALLVLLGAVVIVLLIACANVANLLLARGLHRSREVALRRSLGAGRGRLARQFVVEGLLLASAGAAGGAVLALAGTEVLLSLAPAGIPRADAVGVDARVLAASLTVSTVVGLVFGLVPLLQSRRVDLRAALGSDAGTGAGSRHGRLRSALVISEFALAVLLVVGAGLLLKSFWTIRQVDPGFRADGVLKAEFQLPASRYPVDFGVWPNFAEMHRFNAALLERAAALPGVEAAALAGSHPMDRGFTNSFSVVGSGVGSAETGEISLRFVSPGYFGTVSLPLVRGRTFGAGDGTEAPPVAVINEAAASRLFPDRDPIGQRIAWWGDERRIVGIVGNEKFHGLTASAPMAVYTPLAQTPPPGRSEVLLLRGDGAPEALAGPARDAVRSVDPELAVFGVEPLADTVGRSIGERRFTLLLLGTFAAAAILLAAVGIHGVLSYLVARRTPEIGVRMALGASRARVLRSVVADGARLAAAGLALGLAGALLAGRLLENQLYGVSAADPVTFVCVAAAAFGVALLSCWLPARRATVIDPMTALREE